MVSESAVNGSTFHTLSAWSVDIPTIRVFRFTSDAKPGRVTAH